MVKTRPVDPKSFRDTLTCHPILVLHLWASWNAHDLVVDRVIQSFILEYEGRIEFLSFHVDLEYQDFNPPIPLPTNVPALACFLNGSWLETIIGVRTVSEWQARLEGWLVGVTSQPILYKKESFVHH